MCASSAGSKGSALEGLMEAAWLATAVIVPLAKMGKVTATVVLKFWPIMIVIR